MFDLVPEYIGHAHSTLLKLIPNDDIDNIILVVSQGYVAEVSNEHVILGNDVLATCKIPSFVGDLVDIIAWVDSQGSEYLPKNLGKS